MANGQGWLVRPIFITSTFRDMHAERDWLRDRVFPELEERLRERRCYLEPIDLRVGVDTASVAEAEAKELQVLKVCLAEIERSRPFLIGLIGDRYGWVPPEARMRAAAQEAGFPEEVAGCSVTELEILFGVLASPAHQQRSFFYLREPLPYGEMDPSAAAQYCEARGADEGAAARAQRLERMKARLQATLPEHARRYRAQWDSVRGAVGALECFGAQVLEDLWSVLDHETRERVGAPVPTWQEAEREVLEAFVEERARGFVGRAEELAEFQRCATAAEGTYPVALCVTGEAGSGKSALLAELYRCITRAPADRDSPLVLLHAAGLSPRAGEVESMLRRWVGELAAAAGEADSLAERATPDEVKAAFSGLLHRTAQSRRVVLIVDALDQFAARTEALHLTWLPRPWPGNARLITSAVPGTASEAFAARAGFELRAIRPFSAAEAQAMIGALVARYHRSVDREAARVLLVKRTVQGQVACGNPLWLALAVDALNLFDADDFGRAEREFAGGPEERLCALVLSVAHSLPAEAESAYAWLLDRAQALHGETNTRTFVSLIAASRTGLRESDFAQLVPKLTGGSWDALAFAALRRTFRAHVVRRGAQGQWDFAHAQLRRAVCARHLANDGEEKRLHRALAAHFDTLARDDPLHQTETLAHWIGADAKLEAARYYASDLDATELAGATAALASYMLDDVSSDAATLEWVEALPKVPGLSAEQQYVLSNRFLFTLADTLEYNAPLAARGRIAETARETLAALTAGEPSKADWQSDLAVSHERIGDVLTAQGDLTAALGAYREAAAIAQRVALQEPRNAARYHELSVAHAKIGDTLSAQGDLTAALATFREILAIAQLLADKHPASTSLQLNLSATNRRIGDALRSQGDLKSALLAYRQALTIAQHVASDSESNPTWQFELAISHLRIGDVLAVLLELSVALAAYREGLSILERLASHNPGNAAWQRELAVSHERIGSVWSDQGDLKGALAAFRESLTIRRRLARQDPGNAAWEHDLAVSYAKLGDVSNDQGELTSALAAYCEALAITQRLAHQDPDNVEWQFTLGISHERIGDVHSAQGDLNAAFASFRAKHATIERLARREPGNGAWQRDLVISQHRIGDVLRAQGNRAGALAAYCEALAIAQELVCKDPANAAWQHDLSASHQRVGAIMLAHGNLAAALAAYSEALTIAQRLARADPINARRQRDLAISHFNLGQTAQAKGDVRMSRIHLRSARAVLRGLCSEGAILDAQATAALRHLDEVLPD